MLKLRSWLKAHMILISLRLNAACKKFIYQICLCDTFSLVPSVIAVRNTMDTRVSTTLVCDTNDRRKIFLASNKFFKKIAAYQL